MEAGAATKLATQLNNKRGPLCERVAVRLLATYPELANSLRLEESYSAEQRLSEMAVYRFNELVRAMLMFNMPALADQELHWAHKVLPRHGVTYDHQATMVRYFFNEVRSLELGSGELAVVRELEYYLQGLVKTVYHSKS